MHTQNPTTTEQASDQIRDEGMGPLEDLAAGDCEKDAGLISPQCMSTIV